MSQLNKSANHLAKFSEKRTREKMSTKNARFDEIKKTEKPATRKQKARSL